MVLGVGDLLVGWPWKLGTVVYVQEGSKASEDGIKFESGSRFVSYFEARDDRCMIFAVVEILMLVIWFLGS